MLYVQSILFYVQSILFYVQSLLFYVRSCSFWLASHCLQESDNYLVMAAVSEWERGRQAAPDKYSFSVMLYAGIAIMSYSYNIVGAIITHWLDQNNIDSGFSVETQQCQ